MTGGQTANIIYECQRCHYYSAQELSECPNCGRLENFRAVQRFIPETQAAPQTQATVYVCQNCRYQSQAMLFECPGCGKLRTFAAIQRPATNYVCQYCGYQSQEMLLKCPGCGRRRTLASAPVAAHIMSQQRSEPVMYGCRNLACPYRSEQWSEKCPRCGKSIRPEAQLRTLNLACGLAFTFIGGFVLLLGVWISGAVALGNVHMKAWWPLPAIFTFGGVLILGGLSGIKGRWWLMRGLMMFR
ncbi:MAG TPA: hypothetical protein VGC89_20980 [Pyrinomonadaceae bacterium]